MLLLRYKQVVILLMIFLASGCSKTVEPPLNGSETSPTVISTSAPGATITIRFEGASQVKGRDVNSAREEAIQNALRKAIKWHISELATLSQAEREIFFPKIEAHPHDYIAEYRVNDESGRNNIIRVILDVPVITEKVVDQLLASGYLSAFRHKPRVLLAISAGQIPPSDPLRPGESEDTSLTEFLIAALGKGFIEAGFRVVDPAALKNELNTAVATPDNHAAAKVGAQLGSDVIIIGKPYGERVENKRFGKYQSWRIEAALKAIHCDTARVLAEGNFEGADLSQSERTAKRKAAERLAQNSLPVLLPEIIRAWAIKVATGEATPKPDSSASKPPQILLSSPVDGDITAEAAIRLIGTVEDDRDVHDVKIFVNDVQLALAPVMSQPPARGRAFHINRLAPLKPGENHLRILAFDRDANQTETRLTVIFDKVRKGAPQENHLPHILVYTPGDGQVSAKRLVLLKGEVTADEPITAVSVMVNEMELPVKRDIHLVSLPPQQPATAIDAPRMAYQIDHQITLTQKRNRLKIVAQTASGIKGEKYVTVFAKHPQETVPRHIVIYEPEDQLLTTQRTIPLRGEILADVPIAEITILNNGRELARKKDLKPPPGSPPRYELNHTLALEEGENNIDIKVLFAPAGQIGQNLTVKRVRAAEYPSQPVRIKIDAPLANQTLASDTVQLIGAAFSTTPISQVSVRVNGREPLQSRDLKLTQANLSREGETYTPIHKQMRLVVGENLIQIVVKTESGQEFTEEVQVDYLPNPEFQATAIEGIKQKYAVIVGISKYQDAGIQKLRYARPDAESIYRVITDSQGGGFPADNVRLLVDEQATRERITNTIGEWLASRVEPDDMVLLFYSGHGGVEPDANGEEPDGNNKYLIPYDAKLGNLFSTAILNSMMTTMLRRISSNQLVFLIDCCYSGGTTSGQEVIKSISPASTKVSADIYRAFSGSGRVVISASLPNQVSYESAKLGHGLFTYHLLGSLTTDADVNQDGVITLIAELYPYLSREVSKTARSMGVRQNPTLKCQITGDLVFAKIIQ